MDFVTYYHSLPIIAMQVVISLVTSDIVLCR